MNEDEYDYDADATRQAFKTAKERNLAHWGEVMQFASAYPN